MDLGLLQQLLSIADLEETARKTQNHTAPSPPPAHTQDNAASEALLTKSQPVIQSFVSSQEAGFILERLSQDPQFDIVRRRSGYSKGTSRFCK